MQAGFSAHPYFGDDEAIVATALALDVDQTLPRYLWLSFTADTGTRLSLIPYLNQKFNIVIKDSNGLTRLATVTWVCTILAEPESPNPIILGLSRPLALEVPGEYLNRSLLHAVWNYATD